MAFSRNTLIKLKKIYTDFCMRHCDFYERCKLFHDSDSCTMPKLANMFKERYCLGHSNECARCRVASAIGIQHVPEFMLPSQIDWADQIIKEHKDEQKKEKVSQTSSSLSK